jgi:hypothetical protein
MKEIGIHFFTTIELDTCVYVSVGLGLPLWEKERRTKIKGFWKQSVERYLDLTENQQQRKLHKEELYNLLSLYIIVIINDDDDDKQDM